MATLFHALSESQALAGVARHHNGCNKSKSTSIFGGSVAAHAATVVVIITS
jgi:hypothetical protein